ncbi:hypothetical protein [Rhizobium sp. C4]|uniref:hypothetical protein n=1 Tax=Rhizobium sp. C4 TaxID=1349800 RepID=UPI001E448A32|nr:hypothetical protein [Rhizobium sp. C4]MCD2174285.1 hypothetical protein [Rhizobium sp. C4]
MMSKEPEFGQKFSKIYLVPAELLQDSTRMRRRIGAVVFDHAGNVRDLLNREIGTALDAGGSALADYWPSAFTRIELRDVLDAITIIAKRLDNRVRFLREVERIFDEEQVRYTLDHLGGVHFRVDAEFERSRTSTIGTLVGSRYDGVKDQIDRTFRALDSVPPDGKLAIRSAFFATEGLFRLMFPNAHQLSSSEIAKHLKPIIDQRFSGTRPALQVVLKQLEAFKDWIDGAHFYRHEPGSEEPTQPPLDLAILMVSQATAYIRWLQQFDQN